jgi:hypothetical protein
MPSTAGSDAIEGKDEVKDVGEQPPNDRVAPPVMRASGARRNIGPIRMTSSIFGNAAPNVKKLSENGG